MTATAKSSQRSRFENITAVGVKSICYRYMVQILTPFKNLDSSVSSLRLTADVQRIGSNIRLTFELSDPQIVLELAAPFTANGATVPRKDNLWVATCFEMFLRQPGLASYQEYNFSLQPAWNAYDFEQYRKPQPPKLVEDIYLEHLKWDGQIFQAELSGFKSRTSYEIGLTAVLKEKSGKIHYMALVHKGEKPDFHLSESFILKR